MFRNVIRPHNFCLLKQFGSFKDRNHAFPKATFCSAALIGLNERHAQQTTNVSAFCYVGSTRHKTTATKDVDSAKRHDSTELQPKEIKVDPLVKEIKVEPLTRREKLKKAVKEYGSTVIIFHIGISLISLGTCYLLVTLGLDITQVFEMLGIQEWLSKSQVAANAGTFAVAYAIHKVFAPVRITITLASVPLIVRYLRRIGFLKKVN